jgi:hypothetical protein
MPRRIFAVILIALPNSLAWSDLGSIQQRTAGKSEVKPLELNLELVASRPLVRVNVNGKGPFAFLLSPEADTTLVDRTFSADLDLKPQKGASGGSQLEVSLEIGSTKTTVPAVLTDMAQFVPEFGQAARPRGIIALAVWKDQLVTIDYTRWRVTIEPGVLPVTDGREVFDLSSARELTVPLSVAERSVPCKIDPLFSGGIAVPASFAKELPVTGGSTRRSVNTPTGVLEVQETRVAGILKLGAFDFSNPMIQVSERLSSAMAGGQSLVGFSITYDVTNRRARLQRPKGSPGRD